MIKLIATDLDGTLLDSNKKLPEELHDMIMKLEERGILFVPVSGRAYVRLYKQFEPDSDKMSFICSNGGVVMHKGELIHYTAFTDEELSFVMKRVRMVPGLHSCLCGIHTVYYEPAAEKYRKTLLEFFEDITCVEHLEDIIGTEPITKVSNIDKFGVQENSFPKMADLSDRFSVADAGDNWLDVSPKKGDKGVGIRKLCDKLNLTVDEIMIFGDFLNDLPMMSVTSNSWCMKNGHEDVKQISGHVTEWTNDENGVLRTIEKEVLKTI